MVNQARYVVFFWCYRRKKCGFCGGGDCCSRKRGSSCGFFTAAGRDSVPSLSVAAAERGAVPSLSVEVAERGVVPSLSVAAAERDSVPVPSVEVAEARVGCRVPRPCLRTTPGLPVRPCIAPMRPERGFTSSVPTVFFCRGGKRPAGISCAPTRRFRQTEISPQAIYHAA